MFTHDEVRLFVIEHLRARFPKARQSVLEPQTNLIAAGILDSFAFLALVSELERRFSVSVDLGGYEFDTITTLAGLCDAIVASA
jgi:acyl carrier protein